MKNLHFRMTELKCSPELKPPVLRDRICVANVVVFQDRSYYTSNTILLLRLKIRTVLTHLHTCGKLETNLVSLLVYFWCKQRFYFEQRKQDNCATGACNGIWGKNWKVRKIQSYVHNVSAITILHVYSKKSLFTVWDANNCGDSGNTCSNSSERTSSRVI